MDRSPKIEVYERLRGLLDLIERHRGAEIAQALGDLPQVQLDLRIIEILYKNAARDVRFADVAEALSTQLDEPINRSTVSQALKRLEEREVLRRDYNPSPRQPRVYLTERGQQVASRLAAVEETLPAKVAEAFAGNESEARQLIQWCNSSIERFSAISTHAKASAARVYDYLLGGSHHHVVDRDAADLILELIPHGRESAIANRAFLRRAVCYLTKERGIRQFIDIGSGIPTVGNTHQIAQETNPEAKTVYVDNDPEVVALSSTLLSDNPKAWCIEGDITEPDQILDSPMVQREIDFSEPMAIMLVAILHFVPNDDRAMQAVRRIHDRLCPGSFIVISHGIKQGITKALAEKIERTYQERVGKEVRLRSRQGIVRFFEGTRLIDDGVVYAPEWHPEIEDRFLPANGLPFVDQPQQSMILVGAGEVMTRESARR